LSDPGRQWTQEEIDAQMFDEDDCGECGGEGYVFDCFDGCCADADIGCDLCTTPCMNCNRPKAAT
jgi:hypothetical protein